MTRRDIYQIALDAIGGALFIAAAVIAFTYLPGLIWMAFVEWIA